MLKSKTSSFLIYLLKFIGVFCLAYYGTIAWIGLAAPGHYYSAFIHNYLDYISWIRASLLFGSKTLLNILGFSTYIPSAVTLKMLNGRGVHMGYDCIGYGVLSFWLAFIVANKGSLKAKLTWLFGGWILLWLINIGRISLLLVAINRNWSTPFHIEHHTLFNITAYMAIFILIFFFDKGQKEVERKRALQAPKMTISHNPELS